MKINQKGFSLVEGIIVLLVAVIIGIIGWYVWSKNNSDNVTSTSSVKTVSPNKKVKETTFLNGPMQGWKTYTNYKAGFSIEVPANFLSGYGSECKKTADSYRPVEGLVPTAVIEDGIDFYITESYTYQLGGSSQGANSITNFSSCTKVETNAATVKSSKKYSDSNSPQLNIIPINVTTVKNKNEIAKHASTIFGLQNITVTGYSKNAGGWEDIGLDSTDEHAFNFSFQFRYYEKQKKVVYIAQGQAGMLFNPSGDDFYDNEVVNSFKILN